MVLKQNSNLINGEEYEHIKLEYLWLDGYETPNIRSKAHIDFDSSTLGFSSGEEFQLEMFLEWGFDGSSTEQADGGDSDCILKPVSIYRNTIENTFSGDSYIVLCEVMNRDGTPHSSNTRSKLRDIAEESDELKMWFGIEQEYLFMDPKHDRPYDSLVSHHRKEDTTAVSEAML